jgi:hypothetical protein
VLAGLLIRRSIPAMVAAFILWLAIRLVVEFVFRDHFLAPPTPPMSASCRSQGGCGNGIGTAPQSTGRIGDLVLGFKPGNLVSYQPPTGSGRFSSSRPASSSPSPPRRSAPRSGCCTGAPPGPPSGSPARPPDRRAGQPPGDASAQPAARHQPPPARLRAYKLRPASSVKRAASLTGRVSRTTFSASADGFGSSGGL